MLFSYFEFAQTILTSMKGNFIQLTREPKDFIDRVVFLVLLKYIYLNISKFSAFFTQKKIFYCKTLSVVRSPVCISSHYTSDRRSVCDLILANEPSVLFA
jgi:hypothetical protein